MGIIFYFTSAAILLQNFELFSLKLWIVIDVIAFCLFCLYAVLSFGNGCLECWFISPCFRCNVRCIVSSDEM